MEIERIVRWMEEQIRDLSLSLLLQYFFAWIACCAMAAIALNVLLPEWLRWFKYDDFGPAIGLCLGCGAVALFIRLLIYLTE